tara:strand:+ start:766 stop:1764 length:999 start_codon:yes stop_codon:yes gene_type:complete
MNIEGIVKAPLSELWDKYNAHKFTELPPLYPTVIKENGLVFIGINPSISEADRKQVLADGKNAIQTYDLHGEHKQHSYFKKFIEISEKTNLDWTHFDVLYIRETQQAKVSKLMRTTDGIDFIYQQCQITKKIIDQLLDQEPKKIFIVNNTLARLLLGQEKSKDGNHNIWMGYDFQWNNSIGTYTLKGYPFFFTSMLTGQRALDKGSFERLVWHINFIKSFLKLNTIFIKTITTKDLQKRILRILKGNKFLFPAETIGIPKSYSIKVIHGEQAYNCIYSIGSKDKKVRSGLLMLDKLLLEKLNLTSKHQLKIVLLKQGAYELIKLQKDDENNE